MPRGCPRLASPVISDFPLWISHGPQNHFFFLKYKYVSNVESSIASPAVQ